MLDREMIKSLEGRCKELALALAVLQERVLELEYDQQRLRVRWWERIVKSPSGKVVS